ncbi:unnamed protein product [Dovyalis caffra]|uniref:Exocyst subunit Exo70 family protein n=1 Tax=Dovyalis caffra TaxID=77055 RepID=A0AAV1S182_9ROSI|nr:unnamed protein product [Dovyalis caffra]
MRSICFSPKTISFLSSPRSSPSRFSLPATPLRNLSESTIEQIIENASSMIMKWNPETSAYANVTSLFYENRREAMQFIKCVNDLQKVMHLIVSEDSTHYRLIQAQNLMQIAMKRLQKEFYQILSMNRAHLDPESMSTRSSRTSRSSTSDFEDDVSPDDDLRAAGDSISEVEQVSSIAMADLKSIAECMIAAGYAKECVNVYKIIRKSIIDEGIYRLGVERISSSQVNKMDWEALDLRIKNWLEAIKIAIRTLFFGERILCDHVFAVSQSIRESCFNEISKEGATLLFGFPELVAKSKKPSSSDKMFRALDMYTAISENWVEIESIFSLESTSPVRSQALSSLIKLSESIYALLSNFESSIQKHSSKALVPGGGLHSLTSNAMNYLSLLGDYSNVLTDIISDWPPPEKSSLPESYFDSTDSDDPPAAAISTRFAWLVLVLLCKLDGKAKYYKDVSLSYLFLANNLQHVVFKVRTSNLQYLLGEAWIVKHEAKVRQFAANYERLAWGPVFASLPENPTAEISPEEAKESFKRFNISFDGAYRKQSVCVAADPKLRDEIKVSIARKLVPVYREFYDKHRSNVGGQRSIGVFVRYAPEDIENYLSDLFFGTIDSRSSVSTSTTSSRQRHHA